MHIHEAIYTILQKRTSIFIDYTENIIFETVRLKSYMKNKLQYQICKMIDFSRKDKIIFCH